MNRSQLLVDRVKKTKKYVKEMQVNVEQARLQMMAAELVLEETRREAYEAKNALYNAPSTTVFRPYETAPTEEIDNITQWSLDYRRRVWGTAFAGGFSGKTGTRDMMLLLSLAYLMGVAGTRVFSLTLDDIVRVAAMDKNTVVHGLQSLRESDLLLRVEAHEYALSDLPLMTLEKSPMLPPKSLANRFFCGDRAHDVFGGRYGVKITEIRIWMWVEMNAGQTRYSVAKGAGVGIDTANRAVRSLVEMRLASLDENDKCVAKGANRDVDKWMEWIANKKCLHGKLEERMARMEDNYYFRAETRITEKSELCFN